MATLQSTTKEDIIHALLAGKRGREYEGKHVVIIGEYVEILPTNKESRRALLNRLRDKYPGEIPEFVFVPRAETYILLCLA